MAALRIVECDAIAVIIDEKVGVKVGVAIGAMPYQPDGWRPPQFLGGETPDILNSGRAAMAPGPPKRDCDRRDTGRESQDDQNPRDKLPGRSSRPRFGQMVWVLGIQMGLSTEMRQIVRYLRE